MKNNAILLLLLLLASNQIFAQDKKFKLGLRFAPNIAMNRVVDLQEKDGFSFNNNGAGVRFSAGVTGDFYFGKNYSFYTGLWYTVLRTGMKYDSVGSSLPDNGKSVYNLQYLQMPVALKLFTNEIGTDLKMYFVIGGTLGVKIDEKEKSWETSEFSSAEKPSKGSGHSFGDVGLLLGAGVEYQMGEATTLFFGLSYNRGLLDIASKKGPMWVAERDASDFYKISTSLLSLEAGIKF
ncbi:MAG TPA: porin family protein [Catalimonadaceae bacterium]|nr:porin family protein [Catalimonadaceae bacterium]